MSRLVKAVFFDKSSAVSLFFEHPKCVNCVFCDKSRVVNGLDPQSSFFSFLFLEMSSVVSLLL